MPGSGPRDWLTMPVLLTLVASLVASSAAFEPSVPPAVMLEDAELNDIFFVDADRGWAVGDRGVIWYTDDGGRNWRIQTASVACALRSVMFVDSDHGWIVGGWAHPYTHKSSAIVLRTTDGGRRWTPTPGATLPALERVKFFDRQHGWAMGHASALYPRGVFRSSDGGRSWTTIPGGRRHHLLAGDFYDRQRGVVAGRDGEMGVVSPAQIKPSRTPNVGARHLRCVKLHGSTRGWIVGDGGLVMHTTDGGMSWQTPPGPLPDGVVDHFDFQAVASYEDHCWIAGAPGSSILHSADGGHSWEVFRTGQQVPLRALTFLDKNRGWAVGALGTILATRNGGKTWRVQRRGGSRVALLGVFSEAHKIPLELFVLHSGNEGYLSAVEILNRRDLEAAFEKEVPLEWRAHASLVQVGGSAAHSAWSFPLRQPGLRLSAESIIAGWNRATDGHGQEQLEAYLVQKIRQWRPDVIVTEAASPRGQQPLAHLTNQLLLSAVRRAADATSHVEQITVAGLEPWTVKKVFSTVDDLERATLRITTSQLATRLGRSLEDQASSARGLLVDQLPSVSSQLGFRLLVNALPGEASRRDIFSGIVLPAGGDARRCSAPPALANLDQLGRMAQKRRNVRQLLSRPVDESRQGAAWLGQVDQLTRGLDASSAGDILFELAQHYRRSGQLELAADALDRLVQQYPEHPLTAAALSWLIPYYGSGEMSWRLRRSTRFSRGAMAADYQQPLRSESGPPSPEHVGSVRAVMQAQATTAAAQVQPEQRAQRAVTLAQQVQRTRPALFAEPQLRFPLAASQRLLGVPREAERFYHALAGRSADRRWWGCAKGELWLTHAGSPPPKPVYHCYLQDRRPRLDGRLDDEIWQRAEAAPLRSLQHDDADWPAVVLLASDGQFLYLAASCRQSAAAEYPASQQPRPRDPDLGQRDRVDVLIDIDRDYATFFRLTVDHRGWTGEACLGDTSWNPQWYVAAARDDVSWHVEAAIPLDELAPNPPRPNDAWAIGFQRVVPGTGFQSWTQPAAVTPRADGFGYLIFQ